MLKKFYNFLFLIGLTSNFGFYNSNNQFNYRKENPKVNHETIKENTQVINKNDNNLYPGCYWPWYCWSLEPEWDNNAVYREIVNFPEYPSKGSDKKLTLFYYGPDEYNFKKTIVFDFVYDFSNAWDQEIHFKYIWYKTSDRFSNVTFGNPLTDYQIRQIENWEQQDNSKMVISYKKWGYRKECGYDGGNPGWPCRYWELNHYFQITDFHFI